MVGDPGTRVRDRQGIERPVREHRAGTAACGGIKAFTAEDQFHKRILEQGTKRNHITPLKSSLN